MGFYGDVRWETLLGAASNMTGTTVLTAVFYMGGASDASLQIVWTGTPNGSFVVEVSNTGKVVAAADDEWEDLGLGLANAVGAAGSHFVNVSNSGARWVRVRYTNTSSTGTLTVYAVKKGDKR